MLLGEGLVHLLGERELLVVALEQRHLEVAGGGGLEPGDVDHDGGDEDPGHTDAGEDCGSHPGAGRVLPEREHEVEQQPVHRDDDEAHEERAADARDRSCRGDVVQRDAEVGPREAAEREATAQRLEHHPHRSGEER